jgi:hypothetical protein
MRTGKAKKNARRPAREGRSFPHTKNPKRINNDFIFDNFIICDSVSISGRRVRRRGTGMPVHERVERASERANVVYFSLAIKID